MTGYGKAICELGTKTITVEVKSLNSKQNDIYVRLPNLFKERELDIRSLISAVTRRGKVECTITVEYHEGEQAARISKPVVKEYLSQLLTLKNELNIPGDEPLLQTILRLPESMNSGKDEISETEWEQVRKALNASLGQLDAFRLQEGLILEQDICSHVDRIIELLSKISSFEDLRLERIRSRLKNNLTDFFSDEPFDKNRFEQELVFYLEKLDISEEKVRLQSHCDYFKQVMKESEQMGKKLGFISQEIGREINTLGSKANDFEIQKIVVLMKDDLEKIKEQLMNIL